MDDCRSTSDIVRCNCLCLSHLITRERVKPDEWFKWLSLILMTDGGDQLNSLEVDDDDVCELVVDNVQDNDPYLDDELCNPYLDDELCDSHLDDEHCDSYLGDCADSADRVLFPDANHDFDQ